MNVMAPGRRGSAATPSGGTAVDRGRLGLRAAALAGVCAVVAGAVLLVPVGAQAAVGDGPGGLTLNPASGSSSAELTGEYTSANACPSNARFAANIRIVRAETAFDHMTLDDLLVGLSENIFGLTDAPPPTAALSGIGPGGLARIFGEQGLSSGDYPVALVCYNDSFSVIVAAATTWIHVDLTGGTWNVIEGGGNPTPITTTTTLAVDKTSAVAGEDVTLTATVAGDGAAGTVEFFDGATSLGTVNLSGDHASKTVNSLAVGDHSLTAKFHPTDTDAFTESTSAPLALRIRLGSGGGSDTETLNVTIPQAPGGGGQLTLAVDAAAVNLEQVSGGALEFTGELSHITVSDERDQYAGWDVTGSTSDFTGGGSNTINAKWLGWIPRIVTQNQAQDVAPGSEVKAGDPGLKDPATLGSALSGKGAGNSVLGGNLDLKVPTETPAGDYSATLTVTLMSK